MKKIVTISLVSTALVGTFTAGMLAGNLSKSEKQLPPQSSEWTSINTEESNAAKDIKIDGKTESDKALSEKSSAALHGSSSQIKGTYRCWSFNVGGTAGKCTSPAIVLNTNGTYSMSSEKGTYKISGNQITFSESKIRGPGTFKEGQKQIVFNYSYNGKATTVTYLNYDDPENNKGKMVSVKLTLIFPEGDDRAKWLSSITLVPLTGADTYDALAQNDGNHTIIAEYRSVENGKKYQVTAGASDILGEIDLTTAKGHADFTINVNGVKAEDKKVKEESAPAPTPAPAAKPKSAAKPVAKPTPKPAEPKYVAPKTEPSPASTPEQTPTPEPTPASAPAPSPQPAPQSQPAPAPAPAPSPEPTPAPAPEPAPAPAPSQYAGKPCDPNIPHYSQPGCID